MPNGVATNTRPVYIGGRDDGMTFKGGIDEAAIYSTALTAAARLIRIDGLCLHPRRGGGRRRAPVRLGAPFENPGHVSPS